MLQPFFIDKTPHVATGCSAVRMVVHEENGTHYPTYLSDLNNPQLTAFYNIQTISLP